MLLSSFLWKYFRRYLSWGALAFVALLVFALGTAGMIGVLPALFSQVLLYDGEPSALSGLPLAAVASPGAETEEPDEPSRLETLLRPIERRTDEIKQSFVDLYDGLQQRLGIREGNGLRSPLYFAPILFVLVYLSRSVSSFLATYSFQRIGLGITTDIRNDLYDFILHQSIRFHTAHPSGELFSRVINDVSKVQQTASYRLLDLFQQPIHLVVFLGALFLLNFKLAIICLVAMPAFLYPIVRFGKGMRKTSHRSQERMADLSGLLTEGIRGNRVVKAFGMEQFESRRFRVATARHLKVNMRAQVLATVSSPVIESLAAVGGCALAIYCGGMIRRGELSSPEVMTFFSVLLFLYEPIRKLNKVNLILQEALAAVHRIGLLMATPSEIVDRPSEEPLVGLGEGIEFCAVSFGYAEKRVLEAFDLKVRAGEVVALVGPSGAGKSTVVNLIPRFFDPDGGRVEIDGVDIRKLPIANLRSLVGLVTQDTILFNDSVRHNIAYGQANMPLERIREAAAAAYADEFIMELDHGYDTVIGESGHQLSGGQRQRLAIARALLKNAPILILDEATSHLDTESEVLVQRAIYNLMEGRTALVIAHRLSTVTRADRILVLDQGKIIEEGTHEELLALGGGYKRLYDLQFRT